MESACPIILNCTNYFEWLPHMVDILRSKGIYRIAIGQETKPFNGDKVTKWEYKQDQAQGLIGISIAQDLLFHILDIDTHHEALEKINTVFGIQNQIRVHQLENEFLTLDPNNFPLLKIFCPNSRPLDFF